MRALAGFPRDTLRAIRGVLTDIDDTLTSDGRLRADAYSALERLQRAGLKVVPVTGRPAGWCDQIARMWPVDGVVGENGAFWMRHDPVAGRVRVRHVADPAQRAARRAKLDAIATAILAAVPGCALASDQPYRLADIAIDWCEDVARLPPGSVARIATMMLEAGLSARVSSIHVNGWFGDYDKLSTSLAMLEAEFGVDAVQARAHWLFAGDSPNDAPMFAHFPHAVGVANVRDFERDMDALPAWVTTGRSGAGFVELAQAILSAR